MAGRGRALLVALAMAGLLLGRGFAAAEEWGAIEPGATTVDEVRARYGAPSKETRGKADNYDTLQWVYEDTRAPGGINRMTVDYGLLTPKGYQPTVVRVFRLEPKSKIFGRSTVIHAWGVPDAITEHNGMDVFFYKTGLLVNFDKEGEEATLLTFTPPQTAAGGPAAPTR
jgi:hypothetical protein